MFANKENARAARPTETNVATTACTCWRCAVQRPVFSQWPENLTALMSSFRAAF